MQIEYVAKGSPDCPLVRLFDFDHHEALGLKQMLQQLADGRLSSFALHELDFVNSQNNVHLTFVLNEKEQGIVYSYRNNEFICTLNRQSYANMVEFVSSFALHALEEQGFQWLDETSRIALVMSPSMVGKEGKKEYSPSEDLL